MSAILNEVRRATYLDSIVLMRVSRQIAALPGVAAWIADALFLSR